MPETLRLTVLVALFASVSVAWANQPVSPVPLLALTRGGLVLYDVEANSSTQVQGLGELWEAKLLASP
ncbi:hypothetical protein [Hyalangium gracile]|uniref:hypothetical protein n=1 Tax=Hyalangium gracile TaxID=394092 RepID=UPI001CCAF66C|nr:hypothetical protein [Hyalangium gracile]